MILAGGKPCPHGSELHGPPKPLRPITSDLRQEPGALRTPGSVRGERGNSPSSMMHPMGESKREGLRVDCDRRLEFPSLGLLRRPVNPDSSQPSCRRIRFGRNAHEMAIGPHVVRGMSVEIGEQRVSIRWLGLIHGSHEARARRGEFLISFDSASHCSVSHFACLPSDLHIHLNGE